jgi:hypothetical protein
VVSTMTALPVLPSVDEIRALLLSRLSARRWSGPRPVSTYSTRPVRQPTFFRAASDSSVSYARITVNWIQCPVDGSTILDRITSRAHAEWEGAPPAAIPRTNSWVKSG